MEYPLDDEFFDIQKQRDEARLQWTLIVSCVDFPEWSTSYLEQIEPANTLEI